MRRHKSSRRSKRLWYSAVLAAALVTVAVGLAACGSSNNPASTSSSPTAASGGSSFVGSGSTFAQPLYTAWAQTYQGVAGDKLNYQGVGSTAGIAAIEGKTVQFGATDAPLTEADLQTNGLVQFPTAVGGDRRDRECERRDGRQAHAERRHAGRHLPRQDHQVERRRHQGAEPRP